MKTRLGILALAVALAGWASTREYADPDLDAIVAESYSDLFKAPEMEIAPAKFAQFRREIEERRKSEQVLLEQTAAALSGKDATAREQLQTLNLEASRDTADMARQRSALHCTILETERDLQVNTAMQKFGLSGRIENDLAKVYLAERWPARRAWIERQVAAGNGRNRPHGDIDDIGIRQADKGQKYDVRIGLDGIREMEGAGLLPPDYPQGKVTAYVQALAGRIAANSDARVPVRVTVLATPDIDAFGLPGGFLFVTTGLIASAANEDELAGVIGHEVAHIAARHGERLTEGLSIRNVVSQGAEMAANVFTGGAAGTAKRYVTQYGFMGVGTALNLRLLGVTPDFEAEADQLGLQYVWRAGYDPRGFLAFYDRMASQSGSLRAVSFLHTHPPYPEAMLVTFSELEYLPKEAAAKEDSPEFHEIQDLLAARRGEFESASAAGAGSAPGCAELPPGKGSKVN
jgi:hypothetical protein